MQHFMALLFIKYLTLEFSYLSFVNSIKPFYYININDIKVVAKC